MERFRSYQARNGEFHRACAKAECHRAYDETPGDFAAKRDAVIALAKKLNKTELTARSWASDWRNSGYLRRAAKRDFANPKPGATGDFGGRALEQSTNELAENPAAFRDQYVRQALNLGPKAPAGVMVDQGLLAEAKAMDLNLSEVLEIELRRRIKDERGRQWAEQNKEFIDSYNAYIERNGVFGEDLLDLDDPPV